MRRYECCPEPYPRLSFAMRVQKKFRVMREVGGRALRKNPLLYTTVEMSERDRGAIQRCCEKLLYIHSCDAKFYMICPVRSATNTI